MSTPSPPDDVMRAHYFSTWCIHGHHADCRLTCKFCEKPCRCDCHATTEGFPTSTPNDVIAEELAQRFHEAYERLAPQFGYTTREASAKPWADVPEQNRSLMIAVCSEVLTDTAVLSERRRQALVRAHELIDWHNALVTSTGCPGGLVVFEDDAALTTETSE